MEPVPPETESEPSPSVLEALFPDRVDGARRYVAHLATTGVQHGLIGPRELPRLWSRHVLNCAVVAPAIPDNASVADIGSGAGLPGIVLALARPDLQVVLIEPLERRTRWLSEVVTELDLDVEVRQAKAETLWSDLEVDVVTARAVAGLAELARMSLPLLRVGGRMVALKGDRAPSELETDAELITRLGGSDLQVRRYGAGVVDPPTQTVELALARPAPRWKEPVGDGPARTAARKKQRRRARAAARRQDQGR